MGAFRDSYPLTDKALEPKTFVMEMSLNLAGTEVLPWCLWGRNSEMALNSNWPHPGFG